MASHRSEPKAVLIVGPHRSGTSATSALVHGWGLEPATGDVDRTGDRFNRRGLWEARSLVELNDALLASVGVSWSTAPLLEWQWPARLPDRLAWQKRCEELAARAGAAGDWVWKDPRLCVTLAVWRAVLAGRLLVVVVVRHPLATALSLARRNRFPVGFGLAIWTLSVAHALCAASPGACCAVHFEQLVARPQAAATALHHWLANHGVTRLRREAAGWESLDRSLITSSPPDEPPGDVLPVCWDLAWQLYRSLQPERAFVPMDEQLEQLVSWCERHLPGPFPAAVAEALERQVTDLAAKAEGYEILTRHPVLRWLRAVRRMFRRRDHAPSCQ